MEHKGTQEIKTERLVLRKVKVADAEQMYRNYASDARVTRFLTWPPYESVETAEAFLTSIENSYESLSSYHWAIEYEGEMIGSISAVSVDDHNQCCEIGYCIGYDYWRKGIMSEAMAAVMKFFFCEVGVHKIIAKHDADNPGSGGVMKKCGMTCEGRLRKHSLRKDGVFGDLILYGILQEEYKREGR